MFFLSCFFSVLALARHHWRENGNELLLGTVVLHLFRVVAIISSSHYKRESLGINELTRFHISPCILLLNDILLIDVGQKETNKMKLRKCFFLLIMANLIFNPIHFVWVVSFVCSTFSFVLIVAFSYLWWIRNYLFNRFLGNIAHFAFYWLLLEK